MPRTLIFWSKGHLLKNQNKKKVLCWKSIFYNFKEVFMILLLNFHFCKSVTNLQRRIYRYIRWVFPSQLDLFHTYEPEKEPRLVVCGYKKKKSFNFSTSSLKIFVSMIILSISLLHFLIVVIYFSLLLHLFCLKERKNVERKWSKCLSI